MEKEELLVKELSELAGVEIEFSADKMCDLTVEDRIVVLRYRPEDDDWLYFGVVAEPDGGPDAPMMAKALAMNLFGAETLGLHLGLFGDALILSGTVAMEGLTAESLAERLISLSRHIGKLAEKLESGDAETAPRGEDLSLQWDSGFMQV